ncbi:probable n-acetyltransferase hls1 [Phtheirospermum japonicum]|uniref:Probable n-acetyltransferase hls1 n=1 Tax=Phtheirospermum japonicum TaxID=374723 RepID=A0A830B0Z0_9LAMI|nr:probable n-acetyltransferase hls1 [Phtheirospermum japonicum]
MAPNIVTWPRKTTTNLPLISSLTSAATPSSATRAILVQPVFAHRIRIPSRGRDRQAPPGPTPTPSTAATSPPPSSSRADVDAVLNNKLSLGTFLAVPRGSSAAVSWPGRRRFPGEPAGVVGGAQRVELQGRVHARGPWRVAREESACQDHEVTGPGFSVAGLPVSARDFQAFGFHFLYGLGGDGPNAGKYVRALCGLAHNLARERGCGVVATEVGEPGAAQLRGSALEESIVRRGFVVHQAARGRLQ